MKLLVKSWISYGRCCELCQQQLIEAIESVRTPASRPERSQKQQQKQQVIHWLFRQLCTRKVLSDILLRKHGAESITITQHILQVIVNLSINIIVIRKSGTLCPKILPL